MTETHGTDINETINVKGLEFSAQLNIGAAKWLERVSGTPLTQAMQKLVAIDGENFNVTLVAQLLTALYLARHPGMDPQEAETKIDALGFDDMMEVLSRARPMEFTVKNSPEAPKEAPTEAPTEVEASTGQPSSIT